MTRDDRKMKELMLDETPMAHDDFQSSDDRFPSR